MDAKMEECVKACIECYKTCTKMVTHCLELGGKHASPQHINTLKDCAEICGLAIGFMLRGSAYAEQLCGLCAEICSACATQCEALADGDDAMNNCAQSCRDCAKACGAMGAA